MPEGATKKAARDKLREYEDQLSKGVFIPDKEVLKFQKVGQDWLSQKEQNVRSSTLSMYTGHLENHFNEVNEVPINRITIAVVEKWISKKREFKLNLVTLRKLIVTFNQVMKYAIRHRYIDSNPVRDADRPRSRGEVDEKTMRILSPVEIGALIGSAGSPISSMLFKLAIASGARQGSFWG